MVRARLNPIAKFVSAWFFERSFLQSAVAQRDHPPTERFKDGFDPFPKTFIDDPVEALAIVIDDPPGIAEIVLPAFEQTFIDIAFIEFGIPDQGDHAAKRTISGPVFGLDIVLNQ